MFYILELQSFSHQLLQLEYVKVNFICSKISLRNGWCRHHCLYPNWGISKCYLMLVVIRASWCPPLFWIAALVLLPARDGTGGDGVATKDSNIWMSVTSRHNNRRNVWCLACQFMCHLHRLIWQTVDVSNQHRSAHLMTSSSTSHSSCSPLHNLTLTPRALNSWLACSPHYVLESLIVFEAITATLVENYLSPPSITLRNSITNTTMHFRSFLPAPSHPTCRPAILMFWTCLFNPNIYRQSLRLPLLPLGHQFS